MDKKMVLIVDDEENIVELLRMNLESFGYDVKYSYTGMDAIVKTNTLLPDLILLDLMLPDIDGLQICQMLRLNKKTKNIPIIMITAKSEEEDKVEGLIIGADDYITKPFSIKELEARIQSVLRRTESTKIAEDSYKKNKSILRFKDLTIDLTKYELKKNNKEIELTLTEYKIVKLLLENGDKVTTRESILERIGTGFEKSDNRALDVHIRNIRKKLGEDANESYIETIRGIGYKLK